jgi:hypothetical protein
MGLKEIEWNGVDWVRVTQDRDKSHVVVHMLMKLLIPLTAGNSLTA